MSDPGSTYREREEVMAMRRERDPIEQVRRLLVDNSLSTKPELKEIEQCIKDEVEKVAEECKAAAAPERGMLQANLYSDPCGIRMRGTRSDHWIPATVVPYSQSK